MTNQKPIEPLPSRELVKKWIEDWAGAQMKGIPSEECMEIAAQAAQWGFNQRGAVNEAALQKARDEELEACCEWLIYMQNPRWGAALQEARRPKPKSQAEKALASLDGVPLPEGAWQAVSAALERLRELEEGNG